ncbi:nickel-responsive transcriptional regulator NikR [Candidatus Sumerlaeota bacterium]|nr:nickel-responsive transcriptional regulator NikR [Candidatus Sumerlaeota bacterium]
MAKDAVTRFSLSMAGSLVRQLDAMVRAKGYANRSQAVADMVRAHLVEHRAQKGKGEIAGTITLVYDHHKRDLQAQLTDIQHDHEGLIVSVMHVHLDHHNCMEVLAVRGRAESVKKLADRLTAVKGVKHGKLTVTTTGKEFPA